MGQDLELYWEWLCSISGLYRTQQEILLRCFGSAQGVYCASQAELSHLQKRGCAFVKKVLEFRAAGSPEEIAHRNREKGILFRSCRHREYPQKLLELEDRPYGIFYRGRLPDGQKKSVAIVGARLCTYRGKELAEQLAEEIARAGGAVVSGAAYGIDGAAQWAALEAGGESFAVLGCGVDVCYPASHQLLLERLVKSGGVLSELAPGTRPLRMHFPARNRIISGLSDVVAVIEARKKSGSLITAGFAAAQGRTVFSVPGRPQDELSEGCNELIAQGANVLLSVETFMDTNFSGYKKKKNKLSEDFALAPAEKLVYSSLGLQSRSLWELEACTALSLAELGDALLALEMKGLAKETQRNYYVRV